MSAIAYRCTGAFCGIVPEKREKGGQICDGECETRVCVGLGLGGFDILATITLLVVGILGACSVIPMHPGAAYSMIGVGSLFVLGYIGLVILTRLANGGGR